MKENFRIPVSLSTTKIDKNQKGIWAKISYKETTTTIPQFINALGEGYAFAHLFVHNGDKFNYKERLNCNYKGSQVVAIDIDHTTISFAEFNEIMSTTEIQPTITYTTQNNNIKGYRYRALYVVDELMSGDIYKEIYAHLTNEIVCYFENGTIEIDNNANKLNQQFAGNGTPNFEYCESEVYNLEWLLQRYDITMANKQNAENNKKVHDRYIIKQEEGGQSGYIISHNNNGSSNKNNHYNLNNDINKHGRYIEYLINKKLNKLNEGGQSGYIIKKEEEHYKSTMSSLNDSDFINDYYNMNINEIIEKYISIYPSYEFTNVKYSDDDLYYFVPDDYMEIKRKWHFREFEKTNGDTFKIAEIEKCKNGQGRRRRLFINLVIRRLIYPSINFEHLLFNALFELYHFIDNNDKEDIINKKDVAEIAINAYFANMEKWQNLKNYHKPKFKINKEYCNAHNLNARREACKVNSMINKKEKEKKWLEVDKYYNPKLTNKENIDILKENGIEMSLTAIKNYKRERGLTKKRKETIKLNNEKCNNMINIDKNANKAIERVKNIEMAQQPTTTKTSEESANNEQIKEMKRESEHSNIKVMIEGSERELTLSEIRSILFDGKTLTLTSNIIAIRAYNLDDDLKFTMAVINSDLKPSFIVTNKKDDVICFYACDSELNDNEYKAIANEICNDLKTCINEYASERIVCLVNNYDFERGENFGCIANDIIYNIQWLLQRYDITENKGGRCSYIISDTETYNNEIVEESEINDFENFSNYHNNDFWSNKDVLI